MRIESANMHQTAEKENVSSIYVNRSNRFEPESLDQKILILPKVDIESNFAEQAYRTFDRRIM